MLVGLLTGHINLQYMLHKMRRTRTPSCRICNAEKETSVDILCECLALEKIRMQTLGLCRDGSGSKIRARLGSIVALSKRAGFLNSAV